MNLDYFDHHEIRKGNHDEELVVITASDKNDISNGE